MTLLQGFPVSGVKIALCCSKMGKATINAAEIFNAKHKGGLLYESFFQFLTILLSEEGGEPLR